MCILKTVQQITLYSKVRVKTLAFGRSCLDGLVMGQMALQVPLLATASKAQVLSSRHAEGNPDVSIEVGDDGLPLGVFERHSLSPRKSARVVTHQEHLDSWRLTELRTFRQQQRDKEQEEEEKALAAGSDGAKLDADGADGSRLGSVVPGVAGAASPGAVQLQRKLTADSLIADGAASSSAAAESAMQGLFKKQKTPFKMPRKRPSMHSTRHALNPWLQHDSRIQTFPVPAKSAVSQAQPRLAPKDAMAPSQSGNGRLSQEEHIWAGVGGFGRNGRCRDANSIAALQTPRLQQSMLLSQPQYSRYVTFTRFQSVCCVQQLSIVALLSNICMPVKKPVGQWL